MLNASIFSFIILNLVKKAILHFHVTTATDMCMKEIIDSWLRRALWRKIMEILKALILTITVLNLVSKGLSFHYTAIFTGPSILYRTLRYKQFIVPFIDSSNRCIAVGLRPRALLKIRHSDTGVSCKICEIFKNIFFIEHQQWLLFHRAH